MTLPRTKCAVIGSKLKLELFALIITLHVNRALKLRSRSEVLNFELDLPWLRLNFLTLTWLWPWPEHDKKAHYPYFCYWITTNQIDHLVKRGSIKGVIFFAMSWRKSKKRRLIFGPPGVNGLSTCLSKMSYSFSLSRCPHPSMKSGVGVWEVRRTGWSGCLSP